MAADKPCDLCRGRKQVPRDGWWEYGSETCPACLGSGELLDTAQ